MEMSRIGKIQFLKPKLSNQYVVAGFTTRHEGVSRPPFNSFNLGSNTLDASHNVEGNRSILARGFGATVDRLVTVNQVHGTDLLIIDSENSEFSHFLKLECDGIVTNQKAVMIAICVADCVPILLYDPVKRVIAALHAGWKGSAGNIAGKGVEAMSSQFGSKAEDILAAIGPSIAKCCYEVDSPVRNAFTKNAVAWDLFAINSSDDKWKLDLQAANHEQLITAGVKHNHIESEELCVCCNNELFFSYRRSGSDTGRQSGFIMLTNQ